MTGFKQTLCTLLFTMVTGVAVAQNNTNSPYTRYGYGDLSDQNFGNSKAMGGIAFGLRDGAQINPLNPASYTAIDSLTCLFEGGVSLQNMNISHNGMKLNAKNSSFDYLAMQFRLRPWLAMTLGLLPFSNVGYDVSDTQTTDNGLTYARNFTGSGSLYQVYGGLGMKIKKNLSVGVNVSYFWGDIDRSQSMFYPGMSSNVYSYRRKTSLSISDYKLDFGLQYMMPLGKNRSVTLGTVYSPKHKLNSDQDILTMLSTDNESGGITNKSTDIAMELPNSFGAGFTYKYDGHFIVGLDYSFQQWSKTKNTITTDDTAVRKDFESTYDFCNRSKISLGGEYIPNPSGRSYFGHIKYRLGAYYATPYYKVDGKKAAQEYGVTAGFGLPVPRSRSILSISGQFVHVKAKESNLLTENIFRVNIGLTFNERWFFKRRVE